MPPLRDGQFRTNISRQVFIFHLPTVGLRIQKNRALQLRHELGRLPVQQAAMKCQSTAPRSLNDEQRISAVLISALAVPR